MHELSIANNLLNLATQAATEAGAERVTRVVLRVGQLTCVHRSSLEFCYEVVVKGTMLEGSELVIEETPVIIHCSACDKDVALPSIQSFRCPDCGAPSGDIRQGDELEMESLEIVHAEDQSTFNETPTDAAAGP